VKSLVKVVVDVFTTFPEYSDEIELFDLHLLTGTDLRVSLPLLERFSETSERHLLLLSICLLRSTRLGSDIFLL